MSLIFTDDQNYKDIADAIREQNGEDIEYFPNEMAGKIKETTTNITIQRQTNSGTKTVMVNGYGIYDQNSSSSWYRLLNKDGSNFIYNLDSITKSARVIVKFKPTTSDNFTRYKGLFGDNKTGEPAIYSAGAYFASDSSLWLCVAKTSNSRYQLGVSPVAIDKWNYGVIYIDKINSIMYGCLYDENGDLINSKSTEFTTTVSHTSGSTLIGGISNNECFIGLIDLTETCYLIDEIPVWGKLNGKTKNMGFPIENGGET